MASGSLGQRTQWKCQNIHNPLRIRVILANPFVTPGLNRLLPWHDSSSETNCICLHCLFFHLCLYTFISSECHHALQAGTRADITEARLHCCFSMVAKGILQSLKAPPREGERRRGMRRDGVDEVVLRLGPGGIWAGWMGINALPSVCAASDKIKAWACARALDHRGAMLAQRQAESGRVWSVTQWTQAICSPALFYSCCSFSL